MKRGSSESQNRLNNSPKIEGGGVPEKQDPVVELREQIRSLAEENLKPTVLRRIEEGIRGMSCRMQVAACETPEDFQALFKLYGIQDEKWRSTGWLEKNKFGTLVKNIIADARFCKNGWRSFIEFMGPPSKLILDRSILQYSHARQVASCDTVADFYKLFNLHGVASVESCRNASYLQRNGHAKLYKAIVQNDRFVRGKWPSFQRFLGPLPRPVIDRKILLLSIVKQIVACEIPDDFLKLFRLHGIPGGEWRKPRWLMDNGFRTIYTTITRDNRFCRGGWKSFLEFMNQYARILDDSILQLSSSKQVAICKVPNDFRFLFRLHNISDDKLYDGGQLDQRNLKRAIFSDPRFNTKGLQYFRVWMEGIDEESIEARIESLGLEDAMALLGPTPARFRVFIKLNYPELGERDTDCIVTHAFKRLTTKKTYDYSDFEETLEPCTVTSEVPEETDEPTVRLIGVAPGADGVMILCGHNCRVRTAADGSFSAKIALTIGRSNVIDIFGVNHEEKRLSSPISFTVEQTETPDDIAALVTLLGTMGKEVLQNIQEDPGRFQFVLQQTEQTLIRKFSRNFEEGRNYVEGLLASSKSPVVRKILKKVLEHFRRIDRTTYPNVNRQSPLYFFQKYCVAEIQRRMEQGDRGVILANAPGLGKTRTALVAVNGDPATIIAPNSVVSAWGEEAEKCLQYSDVLTLRDMLHAKRKDVLRSSRSSHVVTNIEFLRGEAGDERYELLADDETIVVHDEAHALANLGSEQSKGARRLQGKFHLFLTATPFKNPRMMRRMLHILHPDDIRFRSDEAFTKAFPANNHEALRTLSLLKDQHVIRFRKEDVLEEMDPAVPLKKQIHKLPRKERISPKQYGEFTMSNEQAEAMYELFLDWPKWTKKYDQYVPKDEIAKMDHLRGNQFTFGKLHALRQTANNPEYVGARGVEDAKAKEMLRTVDACLREHRKVVIFCQYNAQTEKYAKLLKRYNPCLYTGITSRQGKMKNTHGDVMRFKKHEHGGWALDAHGHPVEDSAGVPMLALDYERLTFQNADERKIMIATYSAGAVGVTFTAGKTVIFDDLPRDCIEEIQAEDRTHRIDHEHQTHHTVKYITMVSRYPAGFLERMKGIYVKQQKDGKYKTTTDAVYARKHDYETAYDLFFEQGTFDEVKMENLIAQRNMFQLINDGITDESVLNEGQTVFKGMPSNNDEQSRADSDAVQKT